jgi:hypothetical protein
MKIFGKISTYFIIVFLLAGCDSFLDKEFDASLSEDKVFRSEQLTRQFLVNIYNNLPDGLGQYSDPQFSGASRDVLTDNAQTSWGLHVYNRMNQGAFTSSDNPLAYFWASNFEGIRKANKFLENSHKSNISNALLNNDDNKLLDRLNAEARLLRALFHFQLVIYFGDAPIVTKSFSMDNQGEMNMKRSPANDVLKWIANECDSVKSKLPFVWTSEGNWGRVNGATALALKSRALLYRASDFFNSSKNKEWWAEAAAAAQEFIATNSLQTTSNQHKLYRDGGANSYGEMFYKSPTTIKEFILTRSIWYTRTIDDACVPPGFANCTGRVNPTQNFVDAFECTDGNPIADIPNYGTKSPLYNQANPYTNRDPRFAMTVFYNGALWGNPTQRPLEIYTGGNDLSSSSGGTLTGYYLKKWCSPDINYDDPRNQGRAWVIFRFAEILLNYAEAQNEALTTPDQSVYDAINDIRNRAGMPNLPTGLTQVQMRERIRNERRIELSFEDHRYFDVRRWKFWDDPSKKEDMLNIRKVTVTQSGASFTYTFSTPSSLRRQFVTPKHYLFPIPYDQVLKAPNLGQNTGW